MASPMSVVKAAYDAFGRGDMEGMLGMVADQVEWEFKASGDVPFAGPRRNKAEVAAFFAQLAESDEIEVFEPREFIDGGAHIVVLGFERGKVRANGKLFQSEWAHVFTVTDGKIARWYGFADTAPRFV